MTKQSAIVELQQTIKRANRLSSIILQLSEKEGLTEKEKEELSQIKFKQVF